MFFRLCCLSPDDIFVDNAATTTIANQNICLDEQKINLVEQYMSEMYFNHHKSIYLNLKNIDQLYSKTCNLINTAKDKLSKNPLFKLYFYYCP